MPDRGLARKDGLTTPSGRSGHDGALDAALERLAPGLQRDRPDTPDLHVTAVRRMAPVAAQVVPFPETLDARLRSALESRGIRELYTHQAETLAHALARRNAVVVTPTASGRRSVTTRRSFIRCSRITRAGRCISFRPRRWRRISSPNCRDCARRWPRSAAKRWRLHLRRRHPTGCAPRIRTRAHLVLSNPDMLHSGILPHHPRWAKLFENLKYIVIDELHAYRGVFGSHLCNVLRRLQRICRHYGSDPVFLCSSATIANPASSRSADRATLRAGRPERCPARREVLRLRQSAGRQSPTRHPSLVPERDQANRGRIPQTPAAIDRLRPEPAGHRNSDHLPQG